MGVFDKSICDCCVCPMQCVFEQFIEENVNILTNLNDTFLIEIREVKNFIVSGIDLMTGNIIHIPICNIVAFAAILTILPDLKPIQPNTKGECVCCEDPITNLANSLIGKLVRITDTDVTILKVGEGIVIGQEDSSIFIFSSCAIDAIEELPATSLTSSEEETAQKPSLWKSLKKEKKITPPPAT
ncbi:hypothetical protein [Chengkuizengella sediminis]|uniref:hypothetical protein n=1 Tax=Chengkuizengella sediminis TaxID=1885917 RepID=UPI00138A1AA9|nr:hypothetical protein [Chengkuizengella sediminis]NDI34552.1 hypothetical protein [Chengkuizengella sediminis]